MASGIVTAAAPLFASVPVVGWIAGIAAAYIDTTYLAPALAGIQGDDSSPSREFDVPAGAQGIGSPTVLGLGRRIRIPAHVVWQSRKARETNSSQKGGSQITQRQVFVDAIINLNIRRTSKLIQLLGNGRLMAWTERDLIGITTPNMSAAWAGATESITVTMDSLNEPSFTSVFEVGDLVRTSNFITSNPSYEDKFQDKIFTVESVLDHGLTASQIVLRAIKGQNFAVAGTATGGTPGAPASLKRLDSVRDIYADCDFIANPNFLRLDGPDLFSWRSRFNVGDEVVIRGTNPSIENNVYRVRWFQQYPGNNDTCALDRISGSQAAPTPYVAGVTFGTINNRATIELNAAQQVTPGFFPANYNIADNFYNGSETQGENAILVEEYGSGNVPGYRGSAYLTFLDFNVTQTGGNLPASIEVILEVDPNATLITILDEILIRSGLTADQVDFSGVTDKVIEGCYVRGAVATSTAIQPLMLAFKLLHQEKSGKFYMFSIENAEVLDLQNDETYSDLGWYSGETPVDPLQFEDTEPKKLPTNIGAKFQDPDYAYAEDQETHSLRNPTGPSHQLSTQLDLSTLAIRRSDVKDIIVNTLRLAWINSTIFRTSLSMRWIHLLENDLVRLTDDAGIQRVGRIVQRDIVENYVVQITCVVEELDLVLRNFPVTNVVGVAPPTFPSLPPIQTVVLDIPAYKEGEEFVRSLGFACSTSQGSSWAGGSIWQSFDETDWQLVGTVQSQVAMGTTTDTFAAASAASEAPGTTTVTFDTVNEIDFQLDYDPGFVSCTETEVRNGVNWFAVISGDDVEIIGIRDFVDNGNGSYTGSYLLRGLRGTNLEATSSTTSGATVVHLATTGISQGGIKYLHFPNDPTQSTIYYKILSPGQSLDDVDSIEVTPVWRSSRPLRLRKIELSYSAGNDITVETTNRTKKIRPVGWIGPYPNPFPMDESYEEYVFLLFDVTGSTLHNYRTLTANGSGSRTLRDKFVTFTAAELTAAGYTPSGSLVPVIDVIQFGDHGNSLSAILL